LIRLPSGRIWLCRIRLRGLQLSLKRLSWERLRRGCSRLSGIRLGLIWLRGGRGGEWLGSGRSWLKLLDWLGRLVWLTGLLIRLAYLLAWLLVRLT
jgi:hypothetical protein